MTGKRITVERTKDNIKSTIFSFSIIAFLILILLTASALGGGDLRLAFVYGMLLGLSGGLTLGYLDEPSTITVKETVLVV